MVHDLHAGSLYYLPSAFNRPHLFLQPLGVLAFWTQMLFYTMIGTHHFVFAPLPWWLQTVAIVFSAGMFIPVVAGHHELPDDHARQLVGHRAQLRAALLPGGGGLLLRGQHAGSFRRSASRTTSGISPISTWHTPHMTMYGIITFALWACMYAILPRLNRPGALPVVGGRPFLAGLHRTVRVHDLP